MDLTIFWTVEDFGTEKMKIRSVKFKILSLTKNNSKNYETGRTEKAIILNQN